MIFALFLWLGLGAALAPEMILDTMAQTAAASKAPSEAAVQRIRPILKTIFPDLNLLDLSNSGLPGIYEAQLSEGVIVYLSPDGRNVLIGEMYRFDDDGVVHVSEERRMRWRSDLLADVQDSAIVFSPSGRDIRGRITVFTDVDCGYCRKIHNEVPELNRRGIEVRYLAFPRSGFGSDTYHKMVSAWCADDPQKMLTRLKRGANIPERTCAVHPIMEHYRLGQRIRVNGTPALLSDDGQMWPGYRPPEQIERLLNL